VSFVLSVLAFTFSTLSFLYQYIPHEKLTYVLTNPIPATIDPQPGEARTYYIESTLTLFNRGNTTATLISALGFLVDDKDRTPSLEADEECNKFHESVRMLPPIEFASTSYPYRRYSGVIEQSKSLLLPLVFALRSGREIVEEQTKGLVCLEIEVADSDGRIFQLNRPLISILFEKEGAGYTLGSAIEPKSHEMEGPQDIYDRVHFRSLF
jgi:hypothetical protein